MSKIFAARGPIGNNSVEATSKICEKIGMNRIVKYVMQTRIRIYDCCVQCPIAGAPYPACQRLKTFSTSEARTAKPVAENPDRTHKHKMIQALFKGPTSGSAVSAMFPSWEAAGPG